MAITLIVEDGSNVPNANSYSSVETLRTWANNRGVELPVEDDEVARLIIRGMDYIESQECKFGGTRTYPTQALAWPRTGVSVFCQPLPQDAMPPQLVAALGQLAKAFTEGFDPWANYGAADYVTEETVGPITTKYADPNALSNGLSATLPAVDALLSQLSGSCNGGAFLSAGRG